MQFYRAIRRSFGSAVKSFKNGACKWERRTVTGIKRKYRLTHCTVTQSHSLEATHHHHRSDHTEHDNRHTARENNAKKLLPNLFLNNCFRFVFFFP